MSASGPSSWAGTSTLRVKKRSARKIESEMDSFVVPGAPASVLLDHGLTDGLLGKLTEAGISSVEQLGGMTPEQLEEIPGIGPKMVERLQAAVVGYYGQFEAALPGTEAASAPAEQVESIVVSGEAEPGAAAPTGLEAPTETQDPTVEVAAEEEAGGPPEDGAEALETDAGTESGSESKAIESDTI